MYLLIRGKQKGKSRFWAIASEPTEVRTGNLMFELAKVSWALASGTKKHLLKGLLD